MLPPLPRPSLFFPIICSAAASFLFYSIFVTPLRPSRALLRPPSRFSTSWTASLFLFWPSSFPSLALLLPLSSRLPLSPLPLRASHESLPGQRGYGATARRPFNRATRAFSIHSAAISWLEYEWNNPLQCRTWFKDFPQMPRNCLENFWKGKVSRGFVTDLTYHVQKLYFLLDTKSRSLRYVELIDIFGVVSVEWFFFLHWTTCQVENHRGLRRAGFWSTYIVLCSLGGTWDVSYGRKMSRRNLIYDKGMIRYYVNFHGKSRLQSA